MSDREHYDNLILGSGEPGKYIAWTLAKAGQRSAVVERRYIGGSCPNIACLPSKNVVHTAKVAQLFSRASEFGISAGTVSVDMKGVRERKRRMVDGLIDVHRGNYEASGAELIMGEERFVAPRTLEVALRDGGTRVVSGERVFLDVGTRPSLPDIPGLAAARPLTHIEALELDVLPEHLVVLGGGYVGVEFAQAFRRLGSRVTVVERGGQLLKREDPDVGEALRQLFEDEGIEIAFDAQTTAVEGRSGDRVRLRLETPDGSRTIEGSHLLVAAGRTPNTDGIGLDVAGVELDDRGYIRVNDRLETTAPGVWAVGECAGSPQFTHVAYDDFRIVRDNLNGGHRTTADRLVPYCVFTDPEIGRVGLNETQAQRDGIPYRLATTPMKAVLRTRTLSETRGFLKALVAADDDRILGLTAFGWDAGELIAVVQTAMVAGLPYTALRDMVLTHPTIAEGLTVLFANEPVPARQTAGVA